MMDSRKLSDGIVFKVAIRTDCYEPRKVLLPK